MARRAGYPTAGFRSFLAGKYVYEDDDPRLTPPYRKARAKLMTAEDFAEVLSPDTTDQERAAFFRVLVDGWKIRDGARESGLSFYAFEQRILRMRRAVELLPRIPDDERFQPFAHDKSLQRRRVATVGRPTRPVNPDSAWQERE